MEISVFWFWFWIIASWFVGGFVGIFVMCCAFVSSASESEAARVLKSEAGF